MIVNDVAFAKKSERSVCKPRTPDIVLDDALKLVRTHHLSAISNEEIFIDFAELKCINNIYKWHIGYRLKAYESEQMIVTLSMDGMIKGYTVSKDG